MVQGLESNDYEPHTLPCNASVESHISNWSVISQIIIVLGLTQELCIQALLTNSAYREEQKLESTSIDCDPHTLQCNISVDVHMFVTHQ